MQEKSIQLYDAITFLNSDDYVAPIMEKYRVFSLKFSTLPRLQLIATVTGAQITKFVITSLNLKSIRTYV